MSDCWNNSGQNPS